MAFASQQSIAHAMGKPRRGRDLKPWVVNVLILLPGCLILLAAVSDSSAVLFQEVYVHAVNKISCWCKNCVVFLALIRVVTRESAMASTARAVYEKGSPPGFSTRSPSRSLGLTIGQATARRGCIFLLRYCPERLTKRASLKKGIAVRGAVAFQVWFHSFWLPSPVGLAVYILGNA
jgi:hypothetical protein